jgi:transposase
LLSTAADVKHAFVAFERDKDPAFLRKAATVLDSENRRLLRENIELRERLRALSGQEPAQLALQNEELQRQLALRNKKIFGASSEKRKTKPGTPDTTDTEPQTGHGPREQTELQLVERTHDLDSQDRVCSQCGGALEEWAGQFEDAEEIDVVERRYVRVLNKRKKYRCKCGACIETAQVPARLIPGGRYSTAFAVHVAVAKYADHMPLERQVKIMKRHGLRVESQTLWDQILALAKLLEPVYRRLREYLLLQASLGADETHWLVMDSDKMRWHVWALCAADAVYYQLEDSRSAQAAHALLGDFAGKLMCDGYSAYSALKKQGARFELAHCWAHVRRKFVEVEELHPGLCTEVLDMIGELYEVERAARDESAEERARLRQERSVEIAGRIHSWALDKRALPASPLGKAIAYLGSMWPGLQLFLHDPAVPIDNNGVERALRGVVLGRKNHYGSRSRRGTEVAAVLYSLIESAKLAGVDPSAYLAAAAAATLRGDQAPMPHEFVAS